MVMLSAIRPATYIGKGKVDEIAGLVKPAPESRGHGLRAIADAAAQS